MNDDLYFDGKKFISSRRAAKISGYVNDYIGQLCRDGKLDCRMVGRSWYVGLESLTQHKSSNLIGTRSKGPRDTKNLVAEAAKSEIVLTPKIEQEGLSNFSMGSSTVSFASTLVDVATAPEVVAKPFQVSYPVFDAEVAEGVGSIVPDGVVEVVADILPIENHHPAAQGAFSSVGVRLFVGTLTLLVALSGFRFGLSANQESKEIYAQVWQSVNTEMQASVFSGVANSFGRASLVVYNVVHDWFVNTKETVLVLAGKEEVSVNTGNTNTAHQTENISAGPRQGLVVVPINDNTDRPAVVAKIKNTFSDEVSVSPDDSESGVITPVFKESKGDDYLYVLVPIKN